MGRRLTLPLNIAKREHRVRCVMETAITTYKTLWASLYKAKMLAKQAYIGKDHSLFLYAIDLDMTIPYPKQTGFIYRVGVNGEVSVTKHECENITQLRNFVRETYIN